MRQLDGTTAVITEAGSGNGHGTAVTPPLAQVAFSVVDLAATETWFREGFGFWPAGGSRAMMRGPLASSVQGLPRVASINLCADLLVARRSQSVVSARAVPVRAADGTADAPRLQAV